jgi:pimeloyl-ACP methyl ester carboxylesterase
MWRSNLLYILLILNSFLFSCNEAVKTDEIAVNKDSVGTTNPSGDSYFVSATLSNELSAESLKTLANSFGQSAIADQIKYNVKTYKLLYTTTYKGKPIKASGLMYIPIGLTKKAPLLSLQHGTTFLKKDAPSLTGEFYGVELFASSGYISIMPDFIGYGASADVFHPYYDQKHSALAVIDMIKAAQEYLNKEKIEFNDQLFLAGYSEGGYVTLAAAKEIELNPSYNLNVTAVAAGAGGYDLNEMLRGISTNSTYTYPSYLAFVLKSYMSTYNWDKSFDDYFADKYAKALDTLLTGEYDGGFINSKLTTQVNQLFDEEFYKDLKEGNPDAELKETLTKNSVSGWSTKIPMRLYHGTKDEIIPYNNSEVTLQNFKATGATSVSLTPIPGGGHGSSFVPMLQSFVPWFNSLKK